MALNLGFWLNEGVKGLIGHRLTSGVAVAGMTLSLGLFGFLYSIRANLRDYQVKLLSGFQIEAFLEAGTGFETQQHIGEQISNIDGIIGVDYVSSTEAGEIFSREFGEDLLEILEQNPLPASFKVKIDKKHLRKESIQRIITGIEAIAGVSEVVFQLELFEQLKDKFRSVMNSILISGAFIFIGTMVISLYGTRLSIKTRRNFIYALLISGTNFNKIKLPFIVEGIILGAVSGILAYGAISFLHSLLNRFIISIFLPNMMILIIPAGIILGILGVMLVTNNLSKLIFSTEGDYRY